MPTTPACPSIILAEGRGLLGTLCRRRKNDLANLQKLLKELEGVEKEDRSARFRCALALCIPGQETKTVEGAVEGYITEEPMGTNGFGYDPVFLVKDKDQTMAQLSSGEKNKISHRADALKKLTALLD